jgi:SAM-dependent methyltransferase
MLCGGEQFIPMIQNVGDWVWWKPGRFHIERCQGCQLVMTRPRPTREGLGFYYDQAYSGDETVIDAKNFYQSPAGQLMNRYRLVTLAKVRALESSDRMLDVGCSYGSFISMAALESGCSAFGMDMDAGSISKAEMPDKVSYRVGTLVDTDWGDQRFTVISFIECLEHDPDPVATLSRARELLEPGGLCMVEVPNFRSFWRVVLRSNWLPLLIPQHLVHFTPATLKKTLESAGLEPLHQQSMLFPLEGVAGIAIITARLFGPKPRASPSLGRKIWHGLVDILLFILFWIMEIPSQFLLRVLGLTGHQTIIARRPMKS